MKKRKIDRWDEETKEWVPLVHPHVWRRETAGGRQRLAVAPRAGPIDLLIALSRELPEPFGLLYVLVVSRTGRREGRYQWQETLDRMGIERFLLTHRRTFEEDGRHHLWVHCFAEDATLVYDRHDIIRAYGPLDRFERVLRERGLSPGESVFGVHAYHYHADFDDFERMVLNPDDWRYSPLIESQDCL